MTHMLKDHFEGALSDLKMRNIDTASLHEIIGEFAPLIGMDSDETNALKSKHTGAESTKSIVASKKKSAEESICPSNGYSKVTQQAEASTAQTALDLTMKPKEILHSNLYETKDLAKKPVASERDTSIPKKNPIPGENESVLNNSDTAVIDQSTYKRSKLSLATDNAETTLKTDINQENEESSLDTFPDTSDDLELSDKSFQSLYEIKTVYDLKYYQCKICPKVYDTKYHLNRHLISHGGNKPFRCTKCLKTFSQKCDLNRHMNIHNNLRKYACSVCNKSFKRADYLSKHERQYCGVMKPYKCSKCSKGFEDQEELNEHIRTHNESSFHCEHCPEEFPNVEGLVQHRKIHNKQNEDYSCTKCGQHFTDFSSYVDHFKAHSGERPYMCDLCRKVFSRNHNLMTHMWIHNDEKQHTCHICAKTFTYYSNLQVHLRVHRNERPYKCNECDKGFLTSSDLRRHKRTHSGEKPYKCSKCSAMYARKERLISHMVMHMEEGMDEREALQDGSPQGNGKASVGDVADEENSNMTDGDTERDEEEMEEEEGTENSKS